MSDNLELYKNLWQAADKLRNNRYRAKYKHVVLGFIFLKYNSNAFNNLYQQLEVETGADPKDIAKNANTYHNWKKLSEQLIKDDLTDYAHLKNQTNQKKYSADYADVAGFCKSANIQYVSKNNFILTPGRHIDFATLATDGIAFNNKLQRLTSTLSGQIQKTNELDEAIKLNITSIGYEL